ncbi:hypothetical protein ACOIQQ_001253 [Raoultella planticola]
MAKDSKVVYGASGKTNVLTFEPENLHLVTDKTHPLYDERIAELESRTVKMPEPFKLAKSSSGLTYYYADEVNEALTEQGIKWEAE